MKVYIVERGEYSDREVVGVFSSREKAVAFIEFDIKKEQYQDAYSICDMIIDEPKVTSDNDMFDVFLKRGIWSAKKTNNMGWRERGTLRKGYFSIGNMSGVFFAKDKDHAIKMAQDAYAKMKAEENGL